jgi:hypothetical protein
MALPAAVQAAAFVVLAGGGVALYAQNRSLERKLAELEQAPLPVARGEPEPGAAPTLQAPAATKADVERLHGTLGDVRARVDAQEKRVLELASSATARGGAAGGPAFEEAVREVVTRMTEDPEFRERLAAAAGRPALDKKPTFGALAKALSLDANQETRFREDLKDMQLELWAVLSEERPDGTVPMAEITKSMELPEGDPRRAEAFLNLFKQKIPGREETYVERAIALATAFRRKTAEYLRAPQQDVFSHLDVDLFGVKMD